jgi:DNA modification methylase
MNPVIIGNAELYCGDCVEVLRTLPDNSIEACLTDPPYGLSNHTEADIRACMSAWLAGKPYVHGKAGFMGKDWDSFVPGPEMWKELYRVLKPGAHLLVFAGTRTADLMSLALRLAGFENRDCVMWVFGCLDEATEIATQDGIKPYHKTRIGNPVLCYNPVNAEYSYQPIQEIFEYDYDDTAYRLIGDFGEQVVSRSHRVLIERNGEEVFITAEEAAAETNEISVPVLEDLPALREALHDAHERTSCQKQNVRQSVPWSNDFKESNRQKEADGVAYRIKDGNLRGLRERIYSVRIANQESGKAGMQSELQRGFSCPVSSRKWIDRERVGGLDRRNESEIDKTNDRGNKPGMERRGNVPESQGELCQSADQVCSLSAEVYQHGAERRVCDGTSAEGGDGDRSSLGANGGRASYQPSGDGQPDREFDVVQDECRPQSLRRWRGHKTAVVRVLPFRYTGKVWCIRVPTGCFVAVRNGVAFPTGNSGFPKALDVSAAIDQKLGAEREVVGFSAGFGKGSTFSSEYQTQQGYRPPYEEKAGQPAPITAPATPEAAQWEGWKSQLKPCYEPILLFRKPLDGTIAETVLKWGCGGLNVGACRVEFVADKYGDRSFSPKAGVSKILGKKTAGTTYNGGWVSKDQEEVQKGHSVTQQQGRYPGNLIVSSDAEVEGCFPYTESGARTGGPNKRTAFDGGWSHSQSCEASSGSASRFFQHCDYSVEEIAELNGIEARRVVYSGKASRTDRNQGCESISENNPTGDWTGGKVRTCVQCKRTHPATHAGPCLRCGGDEIEWQKENGTGRTRERATNHHPTCKPSSLLRYLLKLICPPGGTVIDPFFGSGSTGKAALLEGFKVIGIEREPEYFEIAQARCAHVSPEAFTVQAPAGKAVAEPAQGSLL